MDKGVIKKERELVDGRMYYKVMLKRDTLFAFWYEEFGSYNQDATDKVYDEISRAKNITKYKV